MNNTADKLPDLRYPATKVYSADQVRSLEGDLFEKYLDEFSLMQRVAEGIFHCISSVYPEVRQLVIFCGSGNNGGDGYCLARLVAEQGFEVRCYKIADPKTPSAARAMQLASAAGVPIDKVTAIEEVVIEPQMLVVDALLGIGLKRELTGLIADLVELINQASHQLIAVDLPSGICSDTGRVLGNAIKADYTFSCLALKQGYFYAEASTYTGNIYLGQLGLDTLIFEAYPCQYQLIDRSCFEALPLRKTDSHKGSFGQVWAIGGDENLAGALILAVGSALRTGVGRLYVSSLNKHHDLVINRYPAAMFVPLDGILIEAKLSDWNRTSILLGPGLGRGDWGKRLLDQVLASRADSPMVLDADGLNCLALLKESPYLDNAVLTPHPLEAGRLLRCSAAEVQGNRLQACQALVKKYRCTLVLKGKGTLVVAPGESPYLCPLGNSGMATAGMGDVLSGIIAGLLAQGMSGFQAACLGTYSHSLIADYLAESSGERGLQPDDLIDWIQPTLNHQGVYRDLRA